MRRIEPILLLALAPLVLAGCEPDRSGEMAAEIEQEATGADAGQSLVADTLEVRAEGGTGMQASIVMEEIGGSGITGDATISEAQGAAGQARVVINLRAQSPAEGVHQGHIHEGTCEPLGGVTVALPPVNLAAGQGTATSTVSVDPMSVMDGNHVVAYHEVGGSQPVVCGAIPGHTM